MRVSRPVQGMSNLGLGFCFVALVAPGILVRLMMRQMDVLREQIGPQVWLFLPT